MKLSKILVAGLIFGGTILGSGISFVNASVKPPKSPRIGQNAGLMYSNRSNNITNNALLSRQQSDSYWSGFIFNGSRAEMLLPNDQYSLEDLRRLIGALRTCIPISVPRAALRSKPGCYRFIEDHFDQFEGHIRFLELVTSKS